MPLNPMFYVRAAMVVGILALAGYGGWLIHNHGANSVQQKWDAERAERGQALADAQARVRDLEHQLVTDVADIQEEKYVEITALSSQRDALAQRVRLAEARARVPGSTAAPADAEAGPIGPQPELLGSLGPADVDEAYRADVIRVELQACYAQYDRAAAAVAAVGAK